MYNLDTIEFELESWESQTDIVRLVSKVLGDPTSICISVTERFLIMFNAIPTALDSLLQIGPYSHTTRCIFTHHQLSKIVSATAAPLVVYRTTSKSVVQLFMTETLVV
jgi:hypothetical protein